MQKKIKYLILPIFCAVLLCVPLLLGTQYYKRVFISIGQYWGFYLVSAFTLASLFVYMTFKNNKVVLIIYVTCLTMIFWDELSIMIQKSTFF